MNPPLSTLINLLMDAGAEIAVDALRSNQREILQPFSDDEVRAGLGTVKQTVGQTRIKVQEAGDTDQPEDELSDETEFRRPEFERLREPIDSDKLAVRRRDVEDYDPRFAGLFSRIMLIDKLRETRALYGFNRVFPEGDGRLQDRKAMLWQTPPPWKSSWLPAYVVHGEGIYFEIEPELLSGWETRPEVIQRVDGLRSRYLQVQQKRRLRDRPLTPRFVALHTLAHLIMNQLTFECGYSSAALRERLYVAEGDAPMAGVLIYTAAGDAEGTMGGLVRMGKPGYFEPALLTALDHARWCSADPVCMEIGEAGQGPDSCNLAACHNCALVPETACEEFNRFLDRALVVGSHNDPTLGLFAS